MVILKYIWVRRLSKKEGSKVTGREGHRGQGEEWVEAKVPGNDNAEETYGGVTGAGR